MDQISNAARAFRERVGDEARFLGTCDGGDHGTPERPSIWVLGIEPGWSLADQAADEQRTPEMDALSNQYSIELQLSWPYNRNAFKLLAAIDGKAPEHYREFAEARRPFEQGSAGYFKGNLFPEPFNNVGAWDAEAIESTGFVTKSEYQAWLRATRFPVIRSWIEKCRPRLVIGTGLTHLEDFLAITGTTETPLAYPFEVNGQPKRVHVAMSGTVPIAVVPHLSGGANGLNSHEATRIAADRIRTILQPV